MQAFHCAQLSFHPVLSSVRPEATVHILPVSEQMLLVLYIHVNRKRFKTGTIKVKLEQFKTETA